MKIKTKEELFTRYQIKINKIKFISPIPAPVYLLEAEENFYNALNSLHYFELQEIYDFYITVPNKMSYTKILNGIAPKAIAEFTKTISIMNDLFYKFDEENKVINSIWEQLYTSLEKPDIDKVEEITDKAFEEIHQITQNYPIHNIKSAIEIFTSLVKIYNTPWFVHQIPPIVQEVVNEYSLVAAASSDPELQTLGTTLQFNAQNETVNIEQTISANTRIISDSLELTEKLIYLSKDKNG